MADDNALAKITAAKAKLTKQQFRTLKGQVMAGDADGAIKGLKKLLERQKGGKAMITPSKNVAILFSNEKCKGCKHALWICVKPFYYWTADGVKHRENKVAVCRKYAKAAQQVCKESYLICRDDCD